MSGNNWSDVLMFVIWITVIIGGAWFGNKSLKLKKLDLKSQFLNTLVKNAVSYYENTTLNDQAKKKAVVKEVAVSLNNKGFKVSDQTLLDIEQSVESAIKELEYRSDSNDGQSVVRLEEVVKSEQKK